MFFPQTKTINKKIFILILGVIFLGVHVSPANAETTPVNAGFVNGIWYSQSQFFANDNIRIYTAFQNNSGFDLIGKIQFSDNDKIISETNFESIGGQLIQKWTDWKVEAGNHNIKVKIVDAKKSLPGKTPEPIELPPSAQSITNAQEIDHDTDDDKIGNATDPDDDNDRVSDIEEIKNGTDPLVTDEEKSVENIIETKIAETAVENITQKITDIFQNTKQTANETETSEPTKSFLPSTIADKILPSGAQIQYRVIAILAFIFKTPWALLLSGLALLAFLWKLTKIFA